MFQYTICNVPDIDIYARQCHAIEKHVPGIEKVRELVDVDGSQFSIYAKDGAEIEVAMDYYIGGVFVDSDIDLLQFFKSHRCTSVPSVI